MGKILIYIIIVYVIYVLFKYGEKDLKYFEKEIKKENEKEKLDIYEQKGYEAEIKIVNILNRIFSNDKIIHDSYFRDEEMVTTQIDIIVVDKTGIYVIESKNYSGIIKGNTRNKNWIQIFNNKKYVKFSNPVIQNNRHIEDIKINLKDFNLPNNVFKSYIVFGDKCKLDVQYSENEIVIKQNELFYKILQDKESSKEVLSQDEVDKVSKRFMAHANVSKEMKEEHIRRRKEKVWYKKIT